MRRDMTRRTTRGLGLCLGLCLLVWGFVPPALAQFVSGSTGSHGAFPPVAVPSGTTAITLGLANGVVTFLPGGTTATLPNTPAGGFVDGIIHFTTVDVPAGVTLTFIASNPPISVIPIFNTPITILAQGNVNIAGTIDVSGGTGSSFPLNGGGLGGPGGFKGGSGEIVKSSPAAGVGLGPGGGGAGGLTSGVDGGGGGGFGTAGNNDESFRTPGGPTYGTPGLLPLVGGSGGGGGASAGEAGPNGGGGGGGGGAMLIASSTAITIPATGEILANGGTGGGQGGGGGSGGAIRLMANTISNSGAISAAGGVRGTRPGCCFGGGAGGSGRIRLEAFTFNLPGTLTGSVSSGAPGIIFLPQAITVRIARVNNVATPEHPAGAFGGVDIVLDAPGTVPILLEASRVPLGTTVAVTAKPETGAAAIGPVLSPGLTGTVDISTATVNLTFPTSGVFFLEARATFTLP